jgi:hypothetical protein
MFDRFMKFKNNNSENNSDLSKLTDNVQKVTDEVLNKRALNDDLYEKAA